jgi:hypothetical protein
MWRRRFAIALALLWGCDSAYSSSNGADAGSPDAAAPADADAGGASDAGSADARAIADGSDASPAAGDGGAADGGPALIQQRSITAASAAMTTVTFPNAPAKGDTLVLGVGADSLPVSVSGGSGKAFASTTTSTQHLPTGAWVLFGATPADKDIVVSFNGTQGAIAVVAAEFSAFTKLGPTTPVNGANDKPTTAVVTAAAGDLVVAFASTNVSAFSGPFNGFMPLETSASSKQQLLGAYEIAPSPGGVTASWQSGGGGWDSVIFVAQP